jgi:F-type H+-transporting ATPase subunit delta
MSMVVANRYARALADVLGPGADYRSALEQLEAFAAVYRESSELREVFDSPAVAPAQKQRLLGTILAQLELTGATANLLRVLLANYRMALLDRVVEAFRRLAYERLGIAQVKLYSAAEISPADLALIQARFAEITQKQVEVEFHLDGSLVGGLVAQIGSTVYDGSIRGRLERLRQQLMAR